jgi:leader peptidase (prepilin peptidase) / N-methyltransferase
MATIVAVGIAAGVAGQRAADAIDAAVVSIVLVAAAVAAVVDLRCRRLPDALTAPTWLTVWVLMVVDGVGNGTAPDRLGPALVGGATAGAVLGVGWIVGMGLGDVKLGALLGLVAGWCSPAPAAAASRALLLVLCAVASGVVAAACTRQRRFALGPFLALAGAGVLVAGLPVNPP